jgi:hypothetical protein
MSIFNNKSQPIVLPETVRGVINNLKRQKGS